MSGPSGNTSEKSVILTVTKHDFTDVTLKQSKFSQGEPDKFVPM
jgi:hypothetical protein